VCRPNPDEYVSKNVASLDSHQGLARGVFHAQTVRNSFFVSKLFRW
jgi:hypothetical protein